MAESKSKTTTEQQTRTKMTDEPGQAAADPTAVSPGDEPKTSTGSQDGHDGSPEAKK